MVARLPTTLGERLVPQGRRPVASIRPGIEAGARSDAAETLGRSTQRLAGSLQDVSNVLYAREQAAKDLARKQLLADSRIEAFTELSGLQENFDIESDPLTAGDRWRGATDKVLKRYQQRFGGDKAAFTAFRDDFERQRLQGGVEIRSAALKGVKDRGKAAYDSNADALLGMLSTNTDPAKERAIVDQFALLNADAVDNGYMTAEEAGKSRRDFASKGQNARARTDITNDPEAALKKLNDPTQYVGLDEVTRTSLVDTAIRRVDSLRSDRIRLAEKAERDSEKALKKQSEAIAKNLWAMDADGRLTRDDLEAARGSLEVSEYKSLLTALNNQDNPDAKDDPEIVAMLENSVDDRDVAQDATEAVKRGDLTPGTFRSIMDKNRQLRGAGGDSELPTPYKSGRELVKATLDPGLLSGPAETIMRAGQIQALTEFDNWAVAHPDASRADMQNEAQNVVKRYQAITFDKMALGTGLPINYSGTRASMKPADLDAAEQKTVSDLDAGRITREQAAQELRKIDSWRSILQHRQQGTP